MKEIQITRAGAVARIQPEEVTIKITGSPSDDMSTKEAEAFFTREAETLASILSNTLPGGTLDRLLGNLIASRATLFLVPLFSEKDK